MKKQFRIGYISEEETYYSFTEPRKMTISEGINKCKKLFKDYNEHPDYYNFCVDSICLGYDWGNEVNQVFTIDNINPQGILETEAKLMIKEEFNINI